MNELLVVLAVTYLTYLVVASEFPPIDWTRSRLMHWARDGGSMMYLLTCWWCTGFWVSLVSVIGARLLDVRLSVPVLLVPAAALVAGLTGELVNLVFWIKTNLQKDFEDKTRGPL